MRRRFSVFMALFFLARFLSAEEADGEDLPAAGIFPLALVLEAAEYAGRQVWRPDWPLELPPDAFRLVSKDEPPLPAGTLPAARQEGLFRDVSKIVLENADFPLTLSFDSAGRVERFPFSVDLSDSDETAGAVPFRSARMAQVSLVYADEGRALRAEDAPPAAAPEVPPEEAAAGADLLPPPDRVNAAERNPPAVIREMTLSFPPQKSGAEIETSGEDSGAGDTEPWELEFLEYRDFYPYLVRGSRGGDWYFIYFFRGVNEIRETWYDAEGKFLRAYGFSLAEIDKARRIRLLRDFSAPHAETEFFYDSRGFLTGISGVSGFYEVLYYNEDLQRYREYRLPGGAPEDGEASEEARNTGASGIFSFQWDERELLVRVRGVSEEEQGSGLVDYRYEYILDERGNWIERRETEMIRASGLLVPSRETVTRRVLEYRETR